MTTVSVELTVLKNADEAREFLLAAGVKGPSLHPRASLDVNTRERWNGWNHAVISGADANGGYIVVESWHFAMGRVDFSVRCMGQDGHATLGNGCFDPVQWPITVFPAVAHIRHPEHTPVD